MSVRTSLSSAAGIVLSFGLVGCGSISDSIDGLSKSVSNGFNSISDSSQQSSESSSGETKAAALYRGDVRAYTVACLSERPQPGDGQEFVRGIGQIAERHGITDWESSPQTAAAMRDVVASGTLDDAATARLRADLALLGPKMVEVAFAPESETIAGTAPGTIH